MRIGFSWPRTRPLSLGAARRSSTMAFFVHSKPRNNGFALLGGVLTTQTGSDGTSTRQLQYWGVDIRRVCSRAAFPCSLL